MFNPADCYRYQFLQELKFKHFGGQPILGITYVIEVSGSIPGFEGGLIVGTVRYSNLDLHWFARIHSIKRGRGTNSCEAFSLPFEAVLGSKYAQRSFKGRARISTGIEQIGKCNIVPAVAQTWC